MVLSETNPRDDNLPMLFLNFSDCWNKSGHSCQDLPETDLYADDKENIILNHEYYDPTLHAMLEWVVLGDISMKGCYPDWSSVKEMIEENMCANTA